jgi:peptidoglycan/LPS O-acetylase OafA/YrhL
VRVSSALIAPRPVRAATATGRLAWLDLLRGVAALVVALHHATYYYTPGIRAALLPDWFDPGDYGVLVFFLVSGYIVPASLERHGRVRGFWIGRVARIYPLLLVACLIMALPSVFHVREARAGLGSYDPAIATLAHLTMMQDLLGVPNVINVLWTLSYEMAFYLIVVALFVTRVHRRSALVAGVFATTAVVAGGMLPMAVLTGHAGVGPVVVVIAIGLVAAIVAAASERPLLGVVGGIGGGVLALCLVLMNGRIGPWQGLIILAVMFTGTALYRAEHGQIARWAAGLVSVLVLGGAIVAGYRHAAMAMSPDQAASFRVYWTGSVLLAAATFAVGWAVRGRRVPRWAGHLGAISFSVYLLHPVLLMLSDQFGGTPDDDSPLRLAVFVAALIGLSTLTYRYVEQPCQRYGRRLISRSAV